jgi:hypothetical protein
MALAKAEMPSRSNHKDGDDEIVVYKNWIRSSQRWNYVVEERWQVEVMIQQE